MKLGLDDIRGFLAVAEAARFKIAAERLSVTSSALTQRIQKLEEMLGAPLFDRSTRTVRLTELGNQFLPEARRMVDGFDGSLARIRDVIERRAGLVSFACLHAAAHGFLPSLLGRFRARYPDVQVRVLDDTAARIVDHLGQGRAEFGIDMQRGDDPDPEFEFEPIASEPYVVACAPDHAVADMTAVSWAELAKLDYLAFGLDSGIGRQLAVPQQRLRWSYEVQHLGSMLALIQSGFGIGVVPYSAIHGHPSLTFRPIADQKLSRTIGLVRRCATTLSPAAESLRKLAVEVIVEAYEELPGATTVMSLSG